MRDDSGTCATGTVDARRALLLIDPKLSYPLTSPTLECLTPQPDNSYSELCPDMQVPCTSLPMYYSCDSHRLHTVRQHAGVCRDPILYETVRPIAHLRTAQKCRSFWHCTNQSRSVRIALQRRDLLPSLPYVQQSTAQRQNNHYAGRCSYRSRPTAWLAYYVGTFGISCTY